tara:strand:+ start:97 stop:309 length:213 start_codon:yes stop_codon:yes gene_type:complete
MKFAAGWGQLKFRNVEPAECLAKLVVLSVIGRAMLMMKQYSFVRCVRWLWSVLVLARLAFTGCSLSVNGE